MMITFTRDRTWSRILGLLVMGGAVLVLPLGSFALTIPTMKSSFSEISFTSPSTSVPASQTAPVGATDGAAASAQMNAPLSANAEPATVVAKDPTNLIANGSLEAMSGGTPSGWTANRWGTITAVHTYPVPGYMSDRAAEVRVTSRTSGDAKWVFERVSVTPGATYEYRNHYRATVPTEVVIEYEMASGGYQYVWIATAPSTSAWSPFAGSFTVPTGVERATVYHLLNKVGSLSIDDVSLTRVTGTPSPDPDPTPDPTPDPDPITPTPNEPDNLIINGSLEGGSKDAPTGWSAGKWGTITAVHTYPVPGYMSDRAAEVRVTSRTSGDAKWVFDRVAVREHQTYDFSTMYKGTAPTSFVIEYAHADDSRSYVWLGNAAAVSEWTRYETTFTAPAGVVSLVVFQVLATSGTVTIDDVRLEEASTVPNPTGRARVSITFDDAWDSHYDNAFPLLEKYGMKGVFYITTAYLDSSAYAGFLTPDEVRTLHRAGHEIAGHSVTHPSLTTLSNAQLAYELESSKSALESIIGAGIRSIAYPFGSYDSRVIDAVKKAGYNNARTVERGVITAATDPYRLHSFVPEQTTPLSEVYAEIDAAVATKGWVTLAFHEINYSGRQYANTPDYLEAVLTYIAASDIEVVTIEEGYRATY